MIGPAARGAYRDLELRLRPFVARRVAVAADVDDVVQDVFLRMHRGVGALRDDERFGPWVYRVARSAIADHRRARRRQPLAQVQSPEEVAVDATEVEPLGSAEEMLAHHMAPFVATLPSPYREALTLTELEGLTQADAAAMIGVPLSTMKSRVQRGRERLRKVVEDCCAIALDARGRVVGCEPRRDAAGQSSCECNPSDPLEPR